MDARRAALARGDGGAALAAAPPPTGAPRPSLAWRPRRWARPRPGRRRGARGRRRGTGRLPPPPSLASLGHDHRARVSPERSRRRPIRGWRRTRATSSCRRGTRAGTAPRSAARCTRCSRPSTSRPTTASTRLRPRRPRPRACSAWRPRSPRSPASALASSVVRDAVATRVPPRDVRRRTGRRPRARGLRRPRVPHAGRPRRRRLQDRRVGSTADLDAKLARYRLQGASYALALEAATGEPVARCMFLFLTPARRGTRRRPSRRAMARCAAGSGGTSWALSGTRRARLRLRRANTSTPPIGPVSTTSAMYRHDHPIFGLDEHDHRHERHPDDAVDEADDGLGRCRSARRATSRRAGGR